jgi:predicted component of type VI protein secretion system
VLADVLEITRARRTDAARAVDAFVAASRGSGTSTPARSDPELDRVRAAVSECVLATALDVLRSEPFATLEANWRGLRMLLERIRADAGLRIDVLDVRPEDLAAALRALPRSDEFDDPDAFFVVDEVPSIDVLRDLSELAEETSTPCIAAVSPRVLGAETVDQLVDRTEQGAPIDASWEDLRVGEASRWLCATLNRIILHAEKVGVEERVVAGSAAWALASMLAESWRTKGSFANILGRAGAISAPAVWTPPNRVRTAAIATESLVPIAAQKELARWGVLALGSERDSDRVVLAAAPMVSSAVGAYPLPAQLLAGRVVRFVQWVRDQVSPAMDDATVCAAYEQAASVFLFPGLSPAAAMLKAAVSGDRGARTLRIEATASPSQALVPLQIELSVRL